MEATTRLNWRKSTYSSPNGSDCVELAATSRGIAVRDSKNPGAGHFTVSRAQFRALTRQIKRS